MLAFRRLNEDATHLGVAGSPLGTAMSDTYGDVIPCKSRRAQRFAIRMGVRYRHEGDEEWHDGQIENISESGLLFEAERVLPVNTPIEFKFSLPVTLPDEVSAEVVCRGEIVRTLSTSDERTMPAVAATIASYRFQRPCLSCP